MRAAALGLLLVVITAVSHTQTSPPFDVVIVNGRVVDGTGSPWYATYVGATQVRRMVLGDDDRQPGAAELDRMKGLVREAMEQGAVGVSTSLQYAPAPYATTEELIALASEAAKHGGIYATHMRSEGNTVLEALDEAVRIGREARIPVEVWHLKAAGKPNWGRMPEIVAKIEG